MEEKEILGCQSEALAINLLLEEALAKSGGNLVEKNLISLVHEFNSNDISGVQEKNSKAAGETRCW